VVPAALWLAVLAPPLTELLLGYGSTTVADASYLGLVFGMFSLGLVPYMMFQLLLRVFYALHDSRTAMFIGLATMITNIVVSLIVLNTLSPGRVVEGLAVGFGLANVVGTAAAWFLLVRRVGSLDGRRIAGSLVRMHLAALPAMIFVVAMMFTVGVVLHPGAAYGLITVVLGGGGALMLYLLFAKAFGVAELPALARMVGTRFGGGRQVTRP
jgi:putative peptidoglycan lipid II flippase